MMRSSGQTRAHCTREALEVIMEVVRENLIQQFDKTCLLDDKRTRLWKTCRKS